MEVADIGLCVNEGPCCVRKTADFGSIMKVLDENLLCSVPDALLDSRAGMNAGDGLAFLKIRMRPAIQAGQAVLCRSALMEEFEHLKQLVEVAGDDVAKAAGGNKAAGTRVRKAMQDIKSAAQDVRKRILETRAQTTGPT